MTLTRRAVLIGAAANLTPALAWASVDWSASGADSDRGLHDAWDTFLAAYVTEGRDGIARLPYGRIAAADRVRLTGYIRDLANADPLRLSRPAQMAYWINLYNALTVDVVIAAYPVSSIRRIGGNLLRPGPWRKDVAAVNGERLSLDDIEHRILRPIWKDPRVHYGVNCASIGCPNLQPRAYTAARLEGMLDAGARAYVNHPRGVAVRDGRVTASRIYDWFVEDFGGTDVGVLRHVRSYANADLTARLTGATGIAAYAYDWALNDAT